MSEINKNRRRRFSRAELKNNFFNESLGSNSINHLTSRKTTKVYFDDYKKKENESPEKGKIPLYNKNIFVCINFKSHNQLTKIDFFSLIYKEFVKIYIYR